MTEREKAGRRGKERKVGLKMFIFKKNIKKTDTISNLLQLALQQSPAQDLPPEGSRYRKQGLIYIYINPAENLMFKCKE